MNELTVPGGGLARVWGRPHWARVPTPPAANALLAIVPQHSCPPRPRDVWVLAVLYHFARFGGDRGFDRSNHLLSGQYRVAR